MKSAFRNANMASSLALVVICILSTSSYSSPTTDLLETVSRLLRDCSRFYPHADRNMAETLVVRLQVAVDSVRRLASFGRVVGPRRSRKWCQNTRAWITVEATSILIKQMGDAGNKSKFLHDSSPHKDFARFVRSYKSKSGSSGLRNFYTSVGVSKKQNEI